MVAGIPSKVIGYVDELDPSLTMKHGMWTKFMALIFFSLFIELNHFWKESFSCSLQKRTTLLVMLSRTSIISNVRTSFSLKMETS